MLFNNIVSARAACRAWRVMSLTGLLTVGLGGCVALDEYINPYYDDQPESQTSEEGASTDTDSPQTAETSTSSAPESHAANQAGDQTVGPIDEIAAPSLLATVGPNPFLSSALKPSASTEAQYQQALSAMRAEDWRSAERLLSELVQSNPLLSGPMLNLGIAQARQDKDELAQASFENAIKVNQSNQEAYNQLGLLHRKQGRFAEARNSYLRAISVWPGYAPIRLNLGILFELYIGDLAQALNQYQAYQSLQTEPDRKVKGWIKDLQRRLQVTRS